MHLSWRLLSADKATITPQIRMTQDIKPSDRMKQHSSPHITWHNTEAVRSRDATIKPSNPHDVTIKPSYTNDATSITHMLAITTVSFVHLITDSLARDCVAVVSI
ncbi:hypothetical protein TNCV_1274701 [Trichonephila clavipes]|nr:hypothetical protein TNCV_1274701 [Trichonephila clavipes]